MMEAPANNASKRTVQSLKEQVQRLSYFLFGPSTLHLQYEAYLLLSLSLYVVSSFLGLYKSSFGTYGDWCYLFLTTLWLSRHLLIRWCCTWDPSTCRSPTIAGFLAHVLTSHCLSGQTFDQPTPTVIAKQVGTTAPTRRDETFRIQSLLPSSLLYLLQIPKIRIWYPLLDLLQVRRRQFSSSYSHVYRSKSVSIRKEPGSIQRFLNTVWQHIDSISSNYGLTLQFLLPTCLMSWYLWGLYLRFYAPSIRPVSAMTMSPPSARTQNDLEAMQSHGAYQKLEQPMWGCVWYLLTMVGTVLSLLVYCRITLPIPDQVAGGNVIKDVRNEVRAISTSKSSKTSSSSSSKLSKEDAAWPERVRPVTTEHRVRLTLQVAALRLVENIFVCGILPRTGFACRATGHCSEGIQIWQLAKVLYPVGVTSPLRKDGEYGTSFALLVPHPMSALWTVIGVAVVSSGLLLAQSVSWNKTYLAIQGYVCAGEWTLIEGPEAASLLPVAASWDSRRKYRKGDLILYPPGSRRAKVYRATSNSPEGRPYDRYLQRAHQVLRNELGHPETSDLLLQAATVQLGFTLLNAVLWILFKVFGYPAYGLLTALVANMVAAHAVLTIGQTDYDKLQQLSAEIAA